MYTSTDVEFSALVGKRLTAIETDNLDYIRFVCDDGSVFGMSHRQNCCERVEIESFDCSPDRLIGQVVISAEERTNSSDNGDVSDIEPPDDSWTYTFYTIRTNLDTVTIRWNGSSNGYYSEQVDFYRIK